MSYETIDPTGRESNRKSSQAGVHGGDYDKMIVNNTLYFDLVPFCVVSFFTDFIFLSRSTSSTEKMGVRLSYFNDDIDVYEICILGSQRS